MNNKYSRFIVIISLLVIMTSCKKEEPGKTDNNNTVKPPKSYSQYGDPFSNMPENEDVVMYEVNLRAFSSTGNLTGVTERLEDIKDLGINVIWLMPIHPIGEINSVNSPYSIKNYTAVSPEFGTLADLRELTTEAHIRGMAVIMDWVANHTAWDHTWIAKQGWYTTDIDGNIISPPGTNWQDVAELNYADSAMRLAMIDAMKYWILEANVDGFRCDYADGVPAGFWKQAMDTLFSIPGRNLLMLAEGSRLDHFSSGFDLMYGWDFFTALKNIFSGQPAGNLFTIRNNELLNVPSGKYRLHYTTNHDESAWNSPPPVLFNGLKGSVAVSVSMIFAGGVPLFYTGQEVGRQDNTPFFSNSPVDWNMNPEMLEEYKEIMSFYTISKAARQGNLKSFPSTNVLCFTKTLEDEEILVLVNVRDMAVDYTLPSALKNTAWFDAFSGTAVNLGTEAHFENYDFQILKK